MSVLRGRVSDECRAVRPTPDWSGKLEPSLLLLPQIPKPMHGMAPRVVLGRAWWDRERKAAYASTEDHCLACGVHKSQAKYHAWVEGHEVYRIDYGLGRMTYERTVPLCPPCHAYIHRGRLEYLLDSGKITQARFAAIVQHGDRVLLDAGLEPRCRATVLANARSIEAGMAPWDHWRLVVFGVSYHGLHADHAAWVRFHAEKNRREDEE